MAHVDGGDPLTYTLDRRHGAVGQLEVLVAP